MNPPNHHHFAIHKPGGYLSQFVNNQDKRRNKKLLGELHDFPEGTMAIGRLDEDSEGLLLLTTDGQMSEEVRSKKVEKEYYVELDGEVTQEAIAQLKQGVEIRTRAKMYQTLPCKAMLLDPAPVFEATTSKANRRRHRPTSWLSITISEGKFRQVRKMTAAVGFPTLRLIRIRIGQVLLGDMQAGDVVEVDDFQLGHD
ncbi:pseudouridine synthase [Lewinella sp. LCG006]|uniref:pseudouridine synthase n=1 Tax=Lewinella sp. LCG006 TaxID=3231911 RepID=UPI00345FAFEB